MKLTRLHIPVTRNDDELRLYLREKQHEGVDNLYFEDLSTSAFHILQGNGRRSGFLKGYCRHFESPKNIVEVRIKLLPLYRNIIYFVSAVFILMIANTFYIGWGKDFFWFQLLVILGSYAFIALVCFLIISAQIRRFKANILDFCKGNDL